jgi:hypothetical protein
MTTTAAGNRRGLHTDHIPERAHRFDYRLSVHEGINQQVWMIREFYYDEQGEVIGFSDTPVPLAAESEEGIREELLRFTQAVLKPAFDIDAGNWISADVTLTDVTEA